MARILGQFPMHLAWTPNQRPIQTLGLDRAHPPFRVGVRARRSRRDLHHVDETYVKVNGVWHYVYRAVDQYGQVIDVLLSARRDAAAARRFFFRALRTLKVTPSEVVTD